MALSSQQTHPLLTYLLPRFNIKTSGRALQPPHAINQFLQWNGTISWHVPCPWFDVKDASLFERATLTSSLALSLRYKDVQRCTNELRWVRHQEGDVSMIGPTVCIVFAFWSTIREWIQFHQSRGICFLEHLRTNQHVWILCQNEETCTEKNDPFGSLWHNVFLRLNQSIPFRDYISELDCYNQKCCWSPTTSTTDGFRAKIRFTLSIKLNSFFGSDTSSSIEANQADTSLCSVIFLNSS